MTILSIVVPCYNEEEVLYETTNRLTSVVRKLVESGKVSAESFILFVNDGSKDRTWHLISELYQQNEYVYGLNLAGNVGHQNALMAGLMTAKEMSDVIVSIDADLQDDVDVIELMVDKYHEGFDIVYGVRSSRDTDYMPPFAFFIHPTSYELAVAHMGFFYAFTLFDTNQLRHQAVHDEFIIFGFVGLCIRNKSEFH